MLVAVVNACSNGMLWKSGAPYRCRRRRRRLHLHNAYFRREHRIDSGPPGLPYWHQDARYDNLLGEPN